MEIIKPLEARPIHNSWGDHEKIIPWEDAKKGLHTRYNVAIHTLTYKGYTTGDIPIMWYGGNYHINNRGTRDYVEKHFGYKAVEMEKKFKDLNTDFGLDIDGNIIPEDAVLTAEF